MSEETLPFTYKDGPMAGFEHVTLRCTPEEIGAPPVLHRVRKKPKGSTVFAVAQGLYKLTKDDGNVWAIHIPSESDREFSDPIPDEEVAPAEKPERKPRKPFTPEQMEILKARIKKLYGR